MIDIPMHKLNTCGHTAERLTDGSVRITAYDTSQARDVAAELKPAGTAYNDDVLYMLVVCQPRPRIVHTVVIVSHTSTNNWRVITTTPTGVAVETVTSLAAVNDLLTHVLRG